MAMEFGVLASGSCGNAAVVTWAGQGVLIDLGIGPRTMAQRLAKLGWRWSNLTAAVLTHVHGDHWSESGFRHLAKIRRPLFCHATQAAWLQNTSPAFADLAAQGLVRFYEIGQAWAPLPNLRCTPLELGHDGGVTCGFRFEGLGPDDRPRPALAYLTDLGAWTKVLAHQLMNVDLLAVEFNHDVMLQRTSGRDPQLIARVLGDAGHLSNEQAADLVRTVAAHSEPGRLKHLVQLHLSQQCNTPALAVAAAQRVVGQEVAVHTAQQNQPGPCVLVETSRKPMLAAREELVQSLLPGW